MSTNKKINLFFYGVWDSLVRPRGVLGEPSGGAKSRHGALRTPLETRQNDNS